jgi:hypothetical protein
VIRGEEKEEQWGRREQENKDGENDGIMSNGE